jgi:ribosomal protein S18 acetylase RimI-like enzyme
LTTPLVTIQDVLKKERPSLEWILEESFEGWYLLHSKRTLYRIELVRAAKVSGEPVGLVMLKTMNGTVGYVYYIAVARAQRKKGIGKILLENALEYFRTLKVEEVFASVEEDNAPSEALFASDGFSRTSFAEVSKKHGKLHTIEMYNGMRVVPGEILLRRPIA